MLRSDIFWIMAQLRSRLGRGTSYGHTARMQHLDLGQEVERRSHHQAKGTTSPWGGGGG